MARVARIGPGWTPRVRVGACVRACARDDGLDKKRPLRAALCACLDAAAQLVATTRSEGGKDRPSILQLSTIASRPGDVDDSGGSMSKVHGGMKCVKYLLFVFNFI